MSVESEYTPVQTACNGSLTAFAFGFPIFDTSDLKVYLKTVATAVKTLLVETTNYTVSATNNDYTNGGTVTTVSTYSSAYEIIIERDIPYTQPTDLEQAGRIPSETLDDTHDRALMQIQQVNNKIQRALVMPVSDDSALDMELPNEIDRASQFLAFSADGEPVAANSFDGVVTASAYIQTLLVAADAATARATLDAEQDVLTTDGDLLSREISESVRIAAVAAGQVLKSAGAAAIPVWQGLSYKSGSFNRSTAGEEAVSGVGFQPRAILFTSADSIGAQMNWSVAFVDPSSGVMGIRMGTNGTIIDTMDSDNVVHIYEDASNHIEADFTSFDVGGFTITFTLTGTAAVKVAYLCFQ